LQPIASTQTQERKMSDRLQGIDDKYLIAIEDPEEYDRLYKLARSRAIDIYKNWQEITGAIPEQTSTDFEVQGCIEDAVHCGIQHALGIQVPLISEED
jgi:hypothetical protein